MYTEITSEAFSDEALDSIQNESEYVEFERDYQLMNKYE